MKKFPVFTFTTQVITTQLPNKFQRKFSTAKIPPFDEQDYKRYLRFYNTTADIKEYRATPRLLKGSLHITSVQNHTLGTMHRIASPLNCTLGTMHCITSPRTNSEYKPSFSFFFLLQQNIRMGCLGGERNKLQPKPVE